MSNRRVARVGELSPGEAGEFFVVYRLVERVLESSLGATMVNLSCLRNWAFRRRNPDPPLRNGEPNPHVHWHVAPRYRDAVTIAGTTLNDEEFGEELTWRARRVDGEQRTATIQLLTSGLGVA